VGEILPGEVNGLAPAESGGGERRGRLLRLALTSPQHAETSVLYAKQGPLF
jgi:hypothetical protein